MNDVAMSVTSGIDLEEAGANVSKIVADKVNAMCGELTKKMGVGWIMDAMTQVPLNVLGASVLLITIVGRKVN